MLTDSQGVTIGIVSGSLLFRAGLSSLLGSMAFGQALEAEDLSTLASQVRQNGGKSPDLVLIEVQDGADDSVEMVVQARGLFPEARVVLMSDDVEIDTMGRCFAAGLDGYLLKDIGRDSLADSLRLVKAGEKVFPSRLASMMVDYSRRLVEPQICMDKVKASHLSGREAEILRCLVEGDSNKLIARKLEITESTVKVHLKSILKKTRVSNRTQAAMWALKHSYVRPGSGFGRATA